MNVILSSILGAVLFGVASLSAAGERERIGLTNTISLRQARSMS